MTGEQSGEGGDLRRQKCTSSAHAGTRGRAALCQGKIPDTRGRFFYGPLTVKVVWTEKDPNPEEFSKTSQCRSKQNLRDQRHWKEASPCP